MLTLTYAEVAVMAAATDADPAAYIGAGFEANDAVLALGWASLRARGLALGDSNRSAIHDDLASLADTIFGAHRLIVITSLTDAGPEIVTVVEGTSGALVVVRPVDELVVSFVPTDRSRLLAAVSDALDDETTKVVTISTSSNDDLLTIARSDAGFFVSTGVESERPTGRADALAAIANLLGQQSSGYEPSSAKSSVDTRPDCTAN